jgi:hypothetical protein
MAMAAALSAAHLAAILFPETLRRLYIVRDNDPAGDGARDSLVERANAAGIEAIVLSPVLEDFNEDLRRLGIDALRANLRVQLAPQDVARFMARSGIVAGKECQGRNHHARPDAFNLGEDRASAFERAIGRQPGRIGNGCGRRFSGAARGPLSIAKQNSRPSPSSAALRPSLRSGCRSVPPDGFVAMKAATVAVQPTEHPMSEHDDYEPEHAASPTDQIAQELQLYGYRPSKTRPIPGPCRRTASSKAPSPTSSTP